MKKQKYVLFFSICFLVFGCQPKTQKDLVDKLDTQLFSDEFQTEGGIDIGYSSEGIQSEIAVSKASEEKFNLTPCGEFGFCQTGSICVNEKLCCPLGIAQECGGQCFPEDCQCVVDGEIVLCLPKDLKYCSKGISCPIAWQCYLDGENYYCLPPDKFYCGKGLICLKNKENCVSKDGDFFCVVKENQLCESGFQCNKKSEVCGKNHCCPKEQPIECGETCCFDNNEKQEECVNPEKSVCLSKWAIYCHGEVCYAGQACAPDGLPICYPENGDYCGNGVWCEPGFVCASDGGCCPQGKPQRCGKVCCPDYYDCLETLSGQKCVYPGKKPCGDAECDIDEYCADEGKNLCLNYNYELCPNGNICGPDTWCANGGLSCCTDSGTQNCGILCCPKDNWKCINSGEACIPKEAEYIGGGKWCNPGTKLNKENGNCDPVGWEPCGSGPACPPDQKCAKDDELGLKQCCPADQATFCKDKCCYTGFQCCSGNICMPPGGDCCWGTNVNEWCPPATYCGKKGKHCIPYGADECENGDFCPIGYNCTESNPSCCPWSMSVACGGECYLYATEICENTIMGETCCPDHTFCESDGYCLDDKYKGKNYDYCGGGKVCLGGQTCGGLCSDFCCESEEACNLSLSSCFSSIWGTKIECKDNGNSITCCGCAGPYWDGIQAALKQMEQCAKGKCKKLECIYTPSYYGIPSCNIGDICCTFNKPNSVSCLKGCVLSGHICHDIPTSNSPSAYKNPQESGILPQNVEVEVGNWCEGEFVSVGIVSAEGYVVFNPAGLSDKYLGNVFKAGLEYGKWVNKFGSGSELHADPGDEVLFVDAVWVIDTMEGKDCPHGPYGQLYWLIHKTGVLPQNFEKKIYLHQFKNNSVFPYKTQGLSGPFNSFGFNSWYACVDAYFLWWDVYTKCSPLEKGSMNTKVDNEWVSGIFMNYDNYAGLYKWKKNESGVYLTLMEADPPSKEAPDRRDDFAGFAYIDHQKTKDACGIWVPLYKYENTLEQGITDGKSDYYYKTNKIAIFLRLRTIICTGKPEDPC